MIETGYVPETEQNLLGALLCGGNHAATVAMLEERHFVNAVHGDIFRLTRLAHDRYSSTMVPTVARLADDATKERCKASTGMDFAVYLARLAAGTTYSHATAGKGAQNVIRQSARLMLAEEGQRLAAAASDPATDPTELVRAAGSAFDEILADVRTGNRRRSRVTAAQATTNAMQAARDAQARRGLTGITSGLLDVDRATGGFQRRDMTLIAARPSMGKTSLATCIAIRAARAGSGVGIISLEMDADKLATRCISDIAHERGTKVPYADVIRGMAGEAELDLLHNAAQEFSGLPIMIEDSPGLSIAAIRVKVEAMAAEFEARGVPLELLLIDHLGLIGASSRYAGNRVQEVGEMTAGIKALAREYGLAAVLLSQLNRAVETRDDKRPMLSDLRDSGAIEQDADVVMFLYRHAYYLERAKPEKLDDEIEWQAELSACRNAGELIIAKQRNGPLGTIPLYVDMPYSAVRNAVKGSYAHG